MKISNADSNWIDKKRELDKRFADVERRVGQHILFVNPMYDRMGEVPLLKWSIAPGASEVPRALTGGKKCIVHGIESVTRPGKCSKAYFWCEPGTHFQMHKHDYQEEILIISGHGAYRTDQDAEWTNIGPKDLYYLPVMVAHEFIVTEDGPLEAFLWFYR